MLAIENSLLKLELYTNSKVETLEYIKLKELDIKESKERSDIKADKLSVESPKKR